MASTKRIIYNPPNVSADTPVTIRCTATVKGEGTLVTADTESPVVGTEMFIVRSVDNPVPDADRRPTAVLGRRVLYTPPQVDEDTPVSIRCTVTTRQRRDDLSVQSTEEFIVLDTDATAPPFSIQIQPDVPYIPDTGTAVFVAVHDDPTRIRWDEITYNWDLVEGEGTLEPVVDAMTGIVQVDRVTFTPEDIPSGTYSKALVCCEIRVKGTGFIAKDMTEDVETRVRPILVLDPELAVC